MNSIRVSVNEIKRFYNSFYITLICLLWHTLEFNIDCTNVRVCEWVYVPMHKLVCLWFCVN